MIDRYFTYEEPYEEGMAFYLRVSFIFDEAEKLKQELCLAVDRVVSEGNTE